MSFLNFYDRLLVGTFDFVARITIIFVAQVTRDCYSFKNGSLSRERFRNEFANRSWDEFSQKLEKTPRGNFGYMGNKYTFTNFTYSGIAYKILFERTDEVIICGRLFFRRTRNHSIRSGRLSI